MGGGPGAGGRCPSPLPQSPQEYAIAKIFRAGFGGAHRGVPAAGAGGIYTEVLKDIARAFLPLSRERARGMLKSLQVYPILTGIRGQKKVQLESLVDLILALSLLAVDYPEIAELDLNPVIVSPGGYWAVDWRIVV